MRLLNIWEREIIREAYHQGIPMTTHDYAVLVGIAWATARKYLQSLTEKGILIQEKRKFRWNPKFSHLIK